MSMTRIIGIAFPRGMSVAWGLLVSLRPWQWTKNALIFLPLIFSVGERWSVADPGLLASLLLRSGAAALVMCALSGSVYLINDILDREQDRAHPRKRDRPIASGIVPASMAAMVAAGLSGVGLIAGWFIAPGVAVAALVYLIVNLGYSLRFKHVVIVDVVLLSSGFILRIVAGSIAIDVVTSPWLYTTVGAGALFLVLGKRQSELRARGQAAVLQRTVLAQYSRDLLNQLITIASTSTLMAYSLYTFAAQNVPENKSMMLTVPFVVFGLFRYLFILERSEDGESPELAIIKDLPLVVNVTLWAVAAFVVLVLNR